MNFDLDKAIAILERTPRVLNAQLSDLPPEWTECNEGPDTWSPYDVVGHLIHGERADWIPRARMILERIDDRRFAVFDRAAQFRESQGKSLAQLLVEFDERRSDNLATLRGWRLTERQLDEEGVHPEFGPVTLRQLLSTWVAHDLTHLTQISRVMAKQYRDAVGPWRAYLRVMEDRP